MGIHGIYKEIGAGQRIALSRFALETYETKGRPLRLAIDTSIWLFQIQSGKGGSNPALRTFYYRLLRLMALAIHPLFVFDGPNKPPFKRNKRTGPNIASIPEFLAKQLLKQFGFPFIIAPGEAEAECALLQREDVVDAVLSEDVDTLMFGSRLTLRNWSPEQSSSKVPTHVNVYDADRTKSGSGLDREGMVLIALLSGGDYIPQGVPGCGPKLAVEAARAGFGKELCAIKRNDIAALKVWREKLTYELKTNESKFFRTKHANLNIPEDFPNPEVLGYYTRPAISSKEKVARIKQTVKWDQPMDYPELRSFTCDAFDWIKLGGAKKFIRNLAPSVLVKELRLKGMRASPADQDDIIERTQEQEAKLIKAIHGKRNHVSTDNITELRISFRPLDLVPIDLSIEEPDDEDEQVPSDVDDEENPPISSQQVPGSPSKFRGPLHYNPDELEKLWIAESYLKVGVPLKVQDWEESTRDARKHLAQKHAARAAGKTGRGGRKNARGGSVVQTNALQRFTRVTKPTRTLDLSTNKAPATEVVDLSESPPTTPTRAPAVLDMSARPVHSTQRSTTPPRVLRPSTQPTQGLNEVNRELDLSRLPTEESNIFQVAAASMALTRTFSQPDMDILELPPTVTKRRRKSPPLVQSVSSIPISTPIEIDLTTPPPISKTFVQNSVPAPAPKTPAQKITKQVLRMRDSLPGAYALEVIDFSTSGKTIEKVDGRMAKFFEDKPGVNRRVRKSGLQTLDLTLG